MASEIRVNKIQNRSGLSTVSFTNTGPVISGVTTCDSFSGTRIVGISSISVGETFLNSRSVGIGTTTTTGRDVGVNTSPGTLIFNATTQETEIYSGNEWIPVGGSDALDATGGTITEVTEGSVVYRVHTFDSTGSFNVLEASNSKFAEIEYLLVAGGGGGGASRGNGNGSGGGGAGGHLTGGGLQVSAKNYTVTVGAGGNGGTGQPQPTAPSGVQAGTDGQDTVFSGPDITSITAVGGGGGAAGASSTPNGRAGGSGGGGGAYSGTGGAGTAGQGYPGGTGVSPSHPVGPNYRGGAGGGAGQRGGDGISAGGSGGKGLFSAINGTSTIRAGGGGGGAYTPIYPQGGGDGGGGAGGGNAQSGGANGTANLGGGGGGADWPNTGVGPDGGNGGSGIAIIRYVISGRRSASASGGSICYHNGKVIHTFTGTGTFTTPSGFDKTCEYVVIGGGGGGGPAGGQTSGGGGAGGYLTGSTSVSGAHTINITVGAGGYYGDTYAPSTTTFPGTHSIAAFPAGSVRSEGGGGGNGYPTPSALMSGGSGGGSGNGSAPANSGDGLGGSADKVAGTNTPATPGQGNPGGNYGGAGSRGAGGGGAGAGGGSPISPTSGGYGGHGIQMPASFQAPFVNIGHTGHAPGNHYVAGGGGGGGQPSGSGVFGGIYNGSTVEGSGPWLSGAGRGNNGAEPIAVVNADGYVDAKQSTGSGGGGGYAGLRAGNGGSGVVLIAYPI